MADTSATAARQSWWMKLLPVLIVIAIIVYLASHFVIVENQQGRNQVFAAVRLRLLNEAQQRYAAGHASGFACQLRQLKPAGTGWEYSSGYDYDPVEFINLTTGEHSGYLFSISSCQADTIGKITQYTVTAAPREPGKTGYWAFCTDQSAVVWSDRSGSAAKCLLERQNGFAPTTQKCRSATRALTHAPGHRCDSHNTSRGQRSVFTLLPRWPDRAKVHQRRASL